MRTLNRVLICGGMLGVAALAQVAPKDGPADFKVPGTRRVLGLALPPETNPSGARPVPPGSCESVEKGIYKECRHAAVAALRAGNDSANDKARPNRDRALHFFLLSIDRDPAYGRVLYNLGVMSTRARPEKWDVALQFYREAVRIDPSPDLAAAAQKEITRAEAISRLESTAEGKRARKFDLDLVELSGKFGDPAVAIDSAKALVKSDPSRWEGPAAAGVLQAALTHYDESAASLENASHLAPAEFRGKLSAAAELAKSEGQYMKAFQEATAAFEGKNYAEAGRLFADAWQASPGRVSTGMAAAVAFLLADKVQLATGVLARIRQLKDPDLSQKAALMLRELAAVSPDAKAAAEAEGGGDVQAVFDVAERIRTLVGDLRSPEVLLVTTGPPPLLNDDMAFQGANDDELNHPKEEYFTANENLFEIYLSRVGARRVPVDGGSSASNSAAASDSATTDTQQPATVVSPAVRPPRFPGPVPAAPVPAPVPTDKPVQQQ